MEDEKRIRRNFSIKPEVDKHLDDYSEEWNVSRSEIVNRAVAEYVDEDKLAKLEGMVEGLQEQVDQLSQEGVAPSSENSETKEKESTPESTTTPSYDPSEQWGEYTDEYLATGPLALTGKRRQGKANRVYNLVDLEYSDGDIVSESDITEAMEVILGELSDYLDETYRDMIHSRMEARGWYYHTLKGAWYRDEAMVTSNLEFMWENEIAPSFGGRERPEDNIGDPEEVAQRISDNAAEFSERLVQNGIATSDEAGIVVSNANKYLERNS